MKDFDVERAEDREEAERERDMTFKLGGEVFRCRLASYKVLDELQRVGTDENVSLLEGMEAAVMKMLIPEDRERFTAVINSDTDPVTVKDLNDVCIWLTEQQVRRPTEAPLLSTPGRSTTGTESTDSSSSPPAAVSAA